MGTYWSRSTQVYKETANKVLFAATALRVHKPFKIDISLIIIIIIISSSYRGKVL